MAPVDPFVVPVNTAGLPLAFCPRPANSDSLVRGLVPAEVARHYWLMERVDVTYSLTVNGTGRGTRSFSMLPSRPAGVERVCGRPLLSYESGAFEEPVGLGITARVGIGDPRLSAPFDGTYTLDVSLGEFDLSGEYSFGLAPQSIWTEADTRSIDFLGNTLTARLTVSAHSATGSIDSLSLTPFWADASPRPAPV
ncbi:MAG: hypothetical protein ACFB20_12685 [Opitutales bacterium]